MRLVIFGLLGTFSAGLVTASSTDLPEVTVQTRGIASLRTELINALESARDRDFSGAHRILIALVEMPEFAQLGPAEQHNALFAAGYTALELKDLPAARSFLERSTLMEEATYLDWHTRLLASHRMTDVADTVLCLTTIMQRWPEHVTSYKERFILTMAHEAKSLPDANIRVQLLDALFRANWRGSDGLEPSELWRDLTLALLESGQLERAHVVATRVTSPYSLIDMRSDRRFDAVVAANPTQFDVEAAAATEILQLESAVTRSPRKLQHVISLASSLLGSLRYDEVLKITDDVLLNVAKNGKKQHYDDADQQLNWIYDVRSRALRRLGRWDEGLAVLIHASQLSETNGNNVSQSINLGSLYTNLMKPREGLAAIAAAGSVSPYGRIQLEKVRFTAALQLNDKAEADRALAYLLEHQSDGIDSYQYILILANRIDEAAALLVSRLDDPEKRSAALIWLQKYPDTPNSPLADQWQPRYEAVLARPEVQAAIKRVGRIDSYRVQSR